MVIDKLIILSIVDIFLICILTYRLYEVHTVSSPKFVLKRLFILKLVFMTI